MGRCYIIGRNNPFPHPRRHNILRKKQNVNGVLVGIYPTIQLLWYISARHLPTDPSVCTDQIKMRNNLPDDRMTADIGTFKRKEIKGLEVS